MRTAEITAYYPGCSSHGTGREYHESAQAVCAHLAIPIENVRDWNCCGASAAHAFNHTLSIGLGARNLALVEDMGLRSVTTPCAGCFSRLKSAQHAMREPNSARSKLRAARCEFPQDDVEVTHLLQFMLERVGLERLESEVKHPLAGAKLAAYYGCLITRPAAVVEFDDPEQPTSMDELLRTLGAETVDWSYKAECCGGGFAASATEVVLELGAQILTSAREAGADAIVVACPLCGSNLDTRQTAMEQSLGRRIRLPILYFTQAMGLAFGLRPKALGLQRLLTDPAPVLRIWGFRS